MGQPKVNWLPLRLTVILGGNTGFNKKALAGGTLTVNCPLVAVKTACTPPVQVPAGLMAAPPSEKPLVLPSDGPVNSINCAPATPGPRLTLTTTVSPESLLFSSALIAPFVCRTPYAVKLVSEAEAT